MNGKLAIITGATSGLGKSYAQLLARLGWNLLLTGRRGSVLTDLKDTLQRVNRIKVDTVVADFNDEVQFKQLLVKIESYPAIDMLINNAGYGCRGGFFEGSYESQKAMLNVHVDAAAHIVHAVVPKMIQGNGGTIINVASLSAFLPAALNYFYCSSKSFLVSFSECLHIDLAEDNIKVQALCPGFIRTKFHARIGLSEDMGYFKDKLLWMDPDEVVRYSLKSLGKSSVICIPGRVNRWIYRLSNVVPKEFCYWVAAKATKRKTSEEVCVI
ncbi:SDR family NAD(P)-dependent oxidoreductase [Saccharicrinis sp. 156]|uniref:SDR family NAD(P)-dependent oxidoreductase n=1 Tax=Saccharicrinis sp. 156 TaxID=3417574 RepID=UPI003D328ACE